MITEGKEITANVLEAAADIADDTVDAGATLVDATIDTAATVATHATNVAAKFVSAAQCLRPPHRRDGARQWSLNCSTVRVGGFARY